MKDRASIQARLDYLSKLVDEPLSIERYAPGDGWARYSIKNSRGNDFSYPTVLKHGEVLTVINAAIAAAELVHHAHGFTNADLATAIRS